MRRRHHNNHGCRSIRRGKTRDFAKGLSRRMSLLAAGDAVQHAHDPTLCGVIVKVLTGPGGTVYVVQVGDDGANDWMCLPANLAESLEGSHAAEG